MTTENRITTRLFYVTFGTAYKPEAVADVTGDVDLVHPMGMHGEGYATIEATSFDQARNIAYAIFGTTTASIYEEKPIDEYAPAGELFRSVWFTEASKATINDVLDQVADAASGDSNDSEISLLTEALDEYAAVAGVSRDDA